MSDSETNTISISKIVEKREHQLKVVSSIADDINNLQKMLEQKEQELKLNQGALIQLNVILEDVGYDLSQDHKEVPTPESINQDTQSNDTNNE